MGSRRARTHGGSWDGECPAPSSDSCGTSSRPRRRRDETLRRVAGAGAQGAQPQGQRGMRGSGVWHELDASAVGRRANHPFAGACRFLADQCTADASGETSAVHRCYPPVGSGDADGAAQRTVRNLRRGCLNPRARKPSGYCSGAARRQWELDGTGAAACRARDWRPARYQSARFTCCQLLSARGSACTSCRCRTGRGRCDRPP